MKLILIAILLAGSLFGAGPGTPGRFDYYMLNLSWAPEFCYSNPSRPECTGHFGFIVHGLWPQYQNGTYPEYCSSQPGLSDPTKMLDIMADVHLVQHEWAAHGVCSGLSADAYFKLIRQIFSSFRIPNELISPRRQLSLSPAEIKTRFAQSNPGLTAESMAVQCGKGPYLTAIEICVTKDGKPTPCAGVRECTKPVLRIPKVQ